MLTKKGKSNVGIANEPSRLQRLYIDAANRLVAHRQKPAIVSTGGHEVTEPITVVCLSDTHSLQPDLPEGDILIHAGDLSRRGNFDELQSQLSWLNAQQHAHKIVIAGNHDMLLDEEFCNEFPHKDPSEPGKSRSDIHWGSVVYLQDSACSITVRGRSLKIYGSPRTPQFGHWAFQYPPIRDVWTDRIPNDVDILVTHGPPLLHLDNNGKGDANLLREIRRVKPRLSVFGHVHTGYGVEVLDQSPSGIQKSWEDIRLSQAGLFALLSMARQSILPPIVDSAQRATILVNAAISQSSVPEAPVVIDL